MLDKQVFVATHHGAGGSMLLNMLAAHRRVGVLSRPPDVVYSDPTVLSTLQKACVARRPTAKVFADRLVLNHELLHPCYHGATFIFLVREPEGTLKHLKSLGYAERAALRYYAYRLRRLCELARRVDNMVVVTWDELVNKSAFPVLKGLFDVRELTSIYRPQVNEQTVDPATVCEGRRCYERHLRYLRAVTGRTASACRPPSSASYAAS